MSRYLAVLFADLERHSVEWARVPRERMVASIAEYRYLAESLASQYGALYREWAGDGHMFVFERADAAAQFGLKLLQSWAAARASLAAQRGGAELPLRLGCHFGDCTALDGAGWIGRGNAVAKRVEAEAEPDSFFVTESVLDLLDLPLYEVELVGGRPLKGDHLLERTLHRLVSFDETALEAKPPDQMSAEDWFLRAVALVGTDREWTDDEEACYREALAIRPDYAEAHMNYAVLLRASGRDGDAARHYQAALDLRGDYPEAHYNYAAMLHGRGSTAGARDHYAEALRLRPDYFDAHHGFANLLAARGEIEPAGAHYEQALALRPDAAAVHNDYAILLERSGALDRAIEHYRRALRSADDDPATHYNYALLLEGRGDVAAAEAHYREAIRLWPDYGEAHNNLAVLLHLQGDLTAAEEHYRRAVDVRPQDPEAHYNYGLVLRARGEHEAAERRFAIARELAPDAQRFDSSLEGPG